MTNEKAPERIWIDTDDVAGAQRRGVGSYYVRPAPDDASNREAEYVRADLVSPASAAPVVDNGWAITVAETLNKEGWLLADVTSEEMDKVAAIIQASAPPTSGDLISRAAAKAALCYMCAKPDHYKPAQPIEGSVRLFHFQGSSNWNAGQCFAQAIDSVPAAATAAPVEQADSLLTQIATICDLGSAAEFGDAMERLQSIRKLIDEHEGAR